MLVVSGWTLNDPDESMADGCLSKKRFSIYTSQSFIFTGGAKNINKVRSHSENPIAQYFFVHDCCQLSGLGLLHLSMR